MLLCALSLRRKSILFLVFVLLIPLMLQIHHSLLHKLSSALHPVNLQSQHPNHAPKIVATSNTYINLHTTMVNVDNISSLSSSSSTNISNSHHLCFTSTLSKPATSLPPSRLAPRMIASSFQPVLAHHLRAWSSPFAVQQCQLLESSLPPSLVNVAYRAVHDALAPSTKSTYAASILRFHQFCDTWCIDDESRMPASPTLL